jgi:hypothetical protein
VTEQPAKSAPERVIAELLYDAPLKSVWLPDAVRRTQPTLEPTLHDLGVQSTLNPVGDEELICVHIGERSSAAAIALATGRVTPAPFVLLCGDPPGPGAAAAAFLATTAGWLVRTGDAQVALLAPLDRLLATASLAGEWRAGPATATVEAGEPETLAALWSAAERDRSSVASIEGQATDAARKIKEARQDRDRTSAELTRLRDAERRELDRIRLEMLEEKAWVATQARRIAGSSSWRTGHWLVRFGRALTLRRDRGTNLPEMIAARMEAEELP